MLPKNVHDRIARFLNTLPENFVGSIKFDIYLKEGAKEGDYSIKWEKNEKGTLASQVKPDGYAHERELRS